MKRVLLIEDDVFLNKVYKAIMEKEGYEVDILSNGLDAVKTAKDKKPDLILLDLIMPEKDGFETLRNLKSDVSTKDTPVYVLTVLQTEGDVQKVKSMGAEKYIFKSDFSFKEVVDFVNERLRN